MEQLSIFEDAVLKATHKTGTTANTYKYFKRAVGLSDDELESKVFAGKAGMVSQWKRKIRFIQQTLKSKGLIQRGENLGQWNVTLKGRKLLSQAPKLTAKIYFVTKHGLAFWGDANTLPLLFEGEVDLIMTSPPYLLTKDRDYGNIGTSEQQYVDELTTMAKGWMKMLSPNGSIVLNIGDSYAPGTGRQSLHKERLLIALNDRLGLHLVQKFTWWSPNKMPTGHWVTKAKKHCVQSTEDFYVLSPSPKAIKADNRKVLVDYSDKFKAMIEKSLSKKPAVKMRPSGQVVNETSFYADNGGAIPHNLLVDTPEGANSAYSLYCKKHKLPRHPAMFPTQIPSFFIRYLTNVNDLVVDPFLGSGVTAYAAEMLQRRWCGTELIKEYLDGACGRFACI